MPNRLKYVLSFVSKIVVVILVWTLLSFYFPRLPFGKPVTSKIPVAASPTRGPLAIPPLKSTFPPAPEENSGTPAYPNPADSTTLPAYPTSSFNTNSYLQVIEIFDEETAQGIMLTVTGGIENYNYRLGPLAEGVYALGPNNNFLVYVTNNGMVYLNRLGEPNFQTVEDARRAFQALNKHVDPYFELSFHDTGFVYVLFIYEGRFGETLQVPLPRTKTHY